ncbi:nuclear transport factor 2 family protein [Sphingopyxis sp. 550A]
MSDDFVRNFFAAADAMDVERFAAYFTHDIVWRYGNSPAVQGIDIVLAQYRQISGVVKAVRHDIVGIWRDGDCVTVETLANYFDHHGRHFAFPACNVMQVEGERFRDVRVFVDNHELFVPPAG